MHTLGSRSVSLLTLGVFSSKKNHLKKKIRYKLLALSVLLQYVLKQTIYISGKKCLILQVAVLSVLASSSVTVCVIIHLAISSKGNVLNQLVHLPMNVWFSNDCATAYWQLGKLSCSGNTTAEKSWLLWFNFYRKTDCHKLCRRTNGLQPAMCSSARSSQQSCLYCQYSVCKTRLPLHSLSWRAMPSSVILCAASLPVFCV